MKFLQVFVEACNREIISDYWQRIIVNKIFMNFYRQAYTKWIFGWYYTQTHCTKMILYQFVR